MRFQLGIQILLLITAAVIAFVVIGPKFTDIRNAQSELMSYRTALENLGIYNQRLQSLLNQASSISDAERTALFRYLPETIDVVAVSRDITNIVESNNMLLLDIEFDELAPVTTTASTENESMVDPTLIDDGVIYDETGMEVGGMMNNQPTGPSLYSQTFNVSVIGNYQQIKSVLQSFERNNYPLKLVEFEFTLDDASSDLTEYTLKLETYSLPTS